MSPNKKRSAPFVITDYLNSVDDIAAYLNAGSGTMNTELVTLHVEEAIAYCDANPNKNLVIDRQLDGSYVVYNCE